MWDTISDFPAHTRVCARLTANQKMCPTCPTCLTVSPSERERNAAVTLGKDRPTIMATQTERLRAALHEILRRGSDIVAGQRRSSVRAPWRSTWPASRRRRWRADARAAAMTTLTQIF
jgi:hypothetical protein